MPRIPAYLLSTLKRPEPPPAPPAPPRSIAKRRAEEKRQRLAESLARAKQLFNEPAGFFGMRGPARAYGYLEAAVERYLETTGGNRG